MSKKDNVCGKPCIVYSRVTGFLQPVGSYNPGKKEEFNSRKYYDVEESDGNTNRN